MTGLDFFSAIYRKGIDLPIRIFFGESLPNFYRPDAVCFCNLSIESEDEITAGKFDLLEGFDVSIVADMDDKTRALAKAIIPSRPRHLVVCDGKDMLSWAPGRGWK